jgi:hypothetical protein
MNVHLCESGYYLPPEQLGISVFSICNVGSTFILLTVVNARTIKIGPNSMEQVLENIHLAYREIPSPPCLFTVLVRCCQMNPAYILTPSFIKFRINFRVAMAKAAFNRKKTLHQQLGLKFKEETSKVLLLEHNFLWCWNVDSSESRSEIPGNFEMWCWRRMERDQLDWSCEKWRSVTQSQGGEECPTYILQYREGSLTGLVTSCIEAAF